METILKKWGNSTAIRIPAGIMADVKFDLNDVVNVRAEKGMIIIEPVRRKDYNLDNLLAAITPDNLHDSTDMGLMTGQEVW